MRTLLTVLITGVAVTLSMPAAAELPEDFDVRLTVRGDTAGAYRVPDGADLKNQRPVVNDSGQVAVRVRGLGAGSEGIWYGSIVTGSLVFWSPTGAVVGDPSINDDGDAAFSVTTGGIEDGVHVYDASAGSQSLVTIEPTGATVWSSVDINDAGELGYRAEVAGESRWGIFSTAFNPNWFTYVSDVGGDQTQLFEPAMAESRYIGGKVINSGVNPGCGEIALFDASMTATPIGWDDNCNDPTTPYLTLDEHVGVVDLDGFANPFALFITTLQSGVEAVFLTDVFSTLTPFASTDHPEIQDILSRPLAANRHAIVTFTGIDQFSLAAVVVGDGITLERVATEGDLVLTDKGMAKITQFEGGPDISDTGIVTFNASLSSPDDLEDWGVGVFVAYPAMFVDDFEGGDLGLWSWSVP